MNANWFQIVMLTYNLNCWLLLFQREEAFGQLGDGTTTTRTIPVQVMQVRPPRN